MANVLDKLPQKETQGSGAAGAGRLSGRLPRPAERLAHELASEWQKSYRQSGHLLTH